MIFSIIICTYNPIIENLNRLLDSILRFSYSLDCFEVILIDNSSSYLVNDLQCVKDFECLMPSFKYYREERRGLTYARMRGIEESSNGWLIFFDDDNYPESNYLGSTERLIQEYPEVVCWGPGKINVQFVDKSNLSWLEDFKHVFQEKDIKGTVVHKKTSYDNTFPTGTGMIIRKDIAFQYYQKVREGTYTLTDRSQAALSSGGDIQMVLHAISLGCSVGVSSILSLVHCIDASKSNLKYLVRHAYATSMYSLKIYNEIFSMNLDEEKFPTNNAFFYQLYYHVKLILLKFGFRKALISFSSYIGRLNGVLLVRPEIKSNVSYRLFKSILKLSFNI